MNFTNEFYSNLDVKILLQQRLNCIALHCLLNWVRVVAVDIYIPELPLSLLFLLKCLHLLLQAPEGEDGEGPKEKDATHGKIEYGRLDEGEAMGRPVVEVGRVGQDPNPDDQANQGGRVEGQPGD